MIEQPHYRIVDTHATPARVLAYTLHGDSAARLLAALAHQEPRTLFRLERYADGKITTVATYRDRTVSTA
jgi:hypothetical protein